MPANLVIPAVFTAVDRVSTVVKTIRRNVSDYAQSAASATSNVASRFNRFIGISQTGLARQERLFKRLTPAIGEAGKQLLSYAKAAAIAGGIIATISFSATQVMAYENALASFRTIVSDLSDKDFAKYRTQIMLVAKDTKKSSVDVAASFETIAGLNAKFAETPEALGKVSASAIILAKASRMELGDAASSLVGIMNQFSLGAEHADRTINVLAAGQAVGAASINQTSEAFVNAGSVMASANISLEQGVALVQTLGKFSVFGAEAGTKLRGSILKLQQAGVGYKSGQFQINDALAEAKARIDKLHSAKAKDAALTKMFGAENIATGRILLSNIEVFKQYTAGVTGTTEAQNAAAINTNTLTAKVDELKARWVNLITGSDGANDSLDKVKNTIGWVTDNLDTLMSVGFTVLKWFVIWKAAILAGRAALFAYNVVTGISIALQGKSAFYVMGNTVAYAAFRTATVAATAAQWLLNAAMYANPIGLIIAAVVALIALTYIIIKKWDDWGAALTIFLGPIGLVISAVQSFRKNWHLVSHAFKTDGIMGALKAIGKVLLDVILYPLQQLLQIVGKLPGKMGEWARQGAAGIASMREAWGLEGKAEADLTPQERMARWENRETPYPQRVLPAANPKTAQNDALADKIKNMGGLLEQKTEITLKMPPGMQGEVTKNQGGKMPQLTTTLATGG